MSSRSRILALACLYALMTLAGAAHHHAQPLAHGVISAGDELAAASVPTCEVCRAGSAGTVLPPATLSEAVPPPPTVATAASVVAPQQVVTHAPSLRAPPATLL